jgi:O-antigen/teichoic acid export membrane protein
VLRSRDLLGRFSFSRLRLPVREVFGFTLPLLVTDLVYVLRSSLVVVLLERFHQTADVAAFQAVFPVARLNLVVFQSFMVLFMPAAGRLFARGDREGINALYWRSAVWIALLTFPLFAVSFSLAQPVTLLLFGSRYADSALLLALLAFGHYFNAALGFNGLTLQVFGRVRYILAADLVGAAASLGINLALIWRFGALGAAIGTCGTLLLQNVLYQAGLRLGGVRVFDWRCFRVYALVLLAAGALLVFESVTTAPLLLSLPLAALVSFLLIVLNRGALDVGGTFPELARLPLARRLLAPAGGARAW